MTLGLVLTVVILATALPDVVWRVDDEAGAAASPLGDPAAAPEAAQDSGAGLVPPLVPPHRPPAPVPPPPAAPAPSDQAPTPPAQAATTTSVPVPTASTPLRVAEGGYASASPGSPLDTAAIPPGALAIGQRAGQPDKITYVRLEGSARLLELAVEQAPGANVLDVLGGIRLCRVTVADWTVGDGDVSIAEAPPYDCGDGRLGVRSGDGTRWSFDLRGLDVNASNGFALVPDTAAAPLFQIVLRGPDQEEP